MGPKQRERAIERLRGICCGLPEVEERLSHGAPTFFVRGKRAFVMVLTNHHGDGRFALWCAAPTGMQAMLVEADPERVVRIDERYYRPTEVDELVGDPSKARKALGWQATMAFERLAATMLLADLRAFGVDTPRFHALHELAADAPAR